MIDIPNDVPKYRKKSTAKPPAKAKHKHVYEPCIIEAPLEWYAHPHERSGKTRLTFRTYCPDCGKIGPNEHGRWLTTVKKHNGLTSYLESVYTEEAERELNPITRTLPVFRADTPWPKSIDILEDLV